jgi:serine/threonine protein kinase
MHGSSPDELDLGATVRGFSAGQKTFRRYSLVRILGRGGMGVVWLARDDELEREVALKFLPDLVLHDRALLENFKTETRRSLELTHRHIVRIYDFVQDEEAACISMEYVDGDTLSHLRARRPNLVFDAPALQRYAAELCEALDYAHTRAKIVHRDIKPSNLMVNSRNEMKVADFGIARSLTDSVSMLTRTRHTSGTLLYMSPQQLDGEPTSRLDDVYSVGAVLYELLTSKPPFYRGQIDHQIRTKPVVPIADRRGELGIEAPPVPPAWERTVIACLAKNPADRPQSAGEIARGLLMESVATEELPPVATARPADFPLVLAETSADSSSSTLQRQEDPRGSSRLKKFAFVLGALGIVIGTVVLGVRAGYYIRSRAPDKSSNETRFERSPSSPSPGRAESGRLVVNTVPANASVYLDGSDRGRTPLVIEGVAPGIHHVSVEARGYNSSSLIADVKTGASFDFGTIHLVAAPEPASPSPTSTALAQSTPPPPSLPAPPSVPTRDLGAELAAFVHEHLRKSVNADITGLLADYADRVDYYENGYVDHSFIARDRQTYAAGWPAVKIVPFGAVRMSENPNANRVTVWFDYHFDARNNKGIHSLGDAANTWVLETSGGGFRIVSEKQNVTNRKRTR